MVHNNGNLIISVKGGGTGPAGLFHGGSNIFTLTKK